MKKNKNNNTVHEFPFFKKELKPRTDREWRNYVYDVANDYRRTMRKNHMEEQIEKTEPIFKKGIQTLLKYINQVIEKYRIDPETGDDFHQYIGEIWVIMNLFPVNDYNQIEGVAHILTAAAIWILDEIMGDLDKRNKIYMLLPRNDRDLDEVISFPNIHHIQYEYDLILSVVYVLAFRDRDIAPVEEEGGGYPMILANQLNSQGLQHKDVPSRRTFEALMELIPKESIERAVGAFEELMRRWVDRVFYCVHIVCRRINSSIDEYNKLIEKENKILRELDSVMHEMDRNKAPEGPLQKPAYNPLLVNPQAAQKEGPVFPSFASGLLPGDPALNLGNGPTRFERIQRLRDQLVFLKDSQELANQEIEKNNDIGYDIASEFRKFGYISDQSLRDKYGIEPGEKTGPMRIENPYAICFALLWLIDHDSDLPWLCGCGCGLMMEVTENLPWGVIDYDEISDPVWNPDEKELEIIASERKALAGKKKTTDLFSDWYERRYMPKGEFEFPRSLTQIVYEETGCIMPRDINLFDWRQKDIRRYGVPQKEINSLLLLFTALSHARRQDKALNLDPLFIELLNEETEEEDGSVSRAEANLPEEITAENLAEQLKEVVANVRELQVSLHESEKIAREARKELGNLRREAELDRRELADLREYIFNQKTDTSREEKPAPEEEDCFPYEVRRNTVVIGGHETWLKEIKPRLKGNIRFIASNITVDAAVIKNADVIWFQPNAVSHSTFYRIADIARQYKKPIRYFTWASAYRGAMQLIKADQ